MTVGESLNASDVFIGAEDLTAEQVSVRTQLAERIVQAVPAEVLKKTHFLQTGVGCGNGCAFCSQEAGPVTRYYDADSVRTVLGGLNAAMRAFGIDQIGGERPHKPGVVFPYLDNDVGSYPHLRDYIDGVSTMGGRTRISTVGWSRLNPELQAMHQDIAHNRQHTVDGIRFSFTPYTLGWRTNPDNYVQDFGNALATYRPFFEAKGVSRATGCIEMRFSPDITIGELTEEAVGPYHLVRCGDYTLVTKDRALSEKQESRITELTQSGPKVDVEGDVALQLVGNVSELDEAAIDNLLASASAEKPEENETYNVIAQVGTAFAFSNPDGRYYCFNPFKDPRSNFNGVHYYPQTEHRLKSGVLDATRPLLNNLLRHKASGGAGPREDMPDATWQDVDAVAAAIEKEAETYSRHSVHRAEYITDKVLPLVKGVVSAMRHAQLGGADFFRYGLLVDTGAIVNQGKARAEFQGLASRPDMPMTPNEDKGYGDVSQTLRGTTWRIAPVAVSTPTSAAGLRGYGRKSLPMSGSAEVETTLHLGFFEWDPGPYDNRNKDGQRLRFYSVAIGDLIRPLVEFDQKVAREQHLLPGY